jgi:cell division protein FtsI (penicillin-binding protein 3)
MESNKHILRRVYVVYIFCCLFAAAILSRVFFVQIAQGEKWKMEAENFMVKELDIEAVRGNIFAVDGSLLATSLPYYEVGIDPFANSFIDDAEFQDSARALAKGLAHVLAEKSEREYARLILKARKDGHRYQLLARNVSFKQLQELKTLPLFRVGKYKGGFIYVQTNKRELPFRMLAARTIGYARPDGLKVGLEGAYDSVLTGISGKRLMRKIAGGVWMPLNNDNEIEPQHGKDVITTIDINIQDVAENALMNSLSAHDAKYGCVVLMEVTTGEIRAIANLTRKDSGVYQEDFNYAIADAREPGSTFKLASLLVAMNDGVAKLSDKVDLNSGEYKYFDRTMKDSHPPKKNEVTLEEAFWESSNVGISRIIHRAYAKQPKQFTDGLNQIGFGKQLGLSIAGEGKSRIKNAGDKDWYGTSLPWLSIGYESLITPLQTLTLYNAVANNGVMVKPRLVKEIQDRGKVVESFPVEVINPAIAKPEAVAAAQQLLEGVVQNGTAKSLKNTSYRVAGKTGTAQVAQGKGYKGANGVTYQASFVGYFPADKPKYSCIVIVNSPSNDAYYGGVVAGPVFKQIADRVYATELDIHNSQPAKNPIAELPNVKRGLYAHTLIAARGLMLKTSGESFSESDVIEFKRNDSGAVYHSSKVNIESVLKKKTMPDMRGMVGADAMFFLESAGYRVRIKGAGTVKSQSIPVGTALKPTDEIELELSL